MIADGDTWLDQALAEGRIEAIDRAFARFLRELDPAVDSRVQIAAALLSHELGEGHICMPLDTLREREPDLGDPAVFLSAARVVADPAGDTAAPLVLEHGLLYMRRFWRDEVRVAQAIRDRLGGRDTGADLHAELARLFPSDGLRPDWQKIACAIAARSGFAVITGGPGTGKTTTVVEPACASALPHRPERLRRGSTRPSRARSRSCRWTPR
jgi:exodeoxyribonuclease V alpha subunit